MIDLIKGIGTAANTADKFVYTEGERQQALSSRHERDMNSDNWLSKSIRPMTLIILLSLQVIMVVLSAFGYHVDQTIVLQNGGLLMAAFGFYFNSRKAEKVAAQNAKANLEIQKEKTRTQTKELRKEARFDRKMKRREERQQETED